jgi:2-oxoglutarate ferredoxin oxidoreductase subunit alpha
MATELNIMIGGEAGQGVQSVGALLCRTLSRAGIFIFADQDYESRVRGGHNFFRIRASDKEVMSASEELDVLVALNAETVELHRTEVEKDGIIVFDSEAGELNEDDGRFFGIPLDKIAREEGGNKLMANTVVAGAALGLIGMDFALLEAVLKEEFSRLGQDIVKGNITSAKAGYNLSRKHKRSIKKSLRLPENPVKRMLLSGNEAVALGALAGGCRFISGYPMTPSTTILEYFARKGGDCGAVAVHVEDEISAINMAIGASFAGARSMTATSGGGFSLMVEGLSLAGMTETPVVIVLGQRPGPATGLPTRTEQGELWYAIHAGHGEFPRAVMAPSTIKKPFTLLPSVYLAERYQTPVIILTDHHLASSYATIEKFDLKQIEIDRVK